MRWLTDLGMKVSANTLCNWLKKGKKYLDKLVKVLKDVALENSRKARPAFGLQVKRRTEN